MTNDTGGQAFAVPGFYDSGAYEDGYCNGPEEGMTLLDAATLAALPVILKSHFKYKDDPDFEIVANIAYAQAVQFGAEKRRREDG